MTYRTRINRFALAATLSVTLLAAFAQLPAGAAPPISEGTGDDVILYYTTAETINSDLSGSDIVIGRAPGITPANDTDDIAILAPYTVTLETGATVTQNANASDGYSAIQVFNSATLTINDAGISSFVSASDSSIVNIGGGTLNAGFAEVSATINITGGTITNSVDAFGSGKVNISGGAVVGTAGNETGAITITGGAVQNASATDDSTLSITGGTVDSAVALVSGAITVGGTADVGGLQANDDATLSITGGSVGLAVITASGSLSITGGTVFRAAATGNNSAITLAGGTLTNFDAANFAALTISGGSVTNAISLRKFQSGDNPTADFVGTGLSFAFVSFGESLTDAGIFGDFFNISGTFNGTSQAYNLFVESTSGTANPEARQFTFNGATPVVVPEAGSLALLFPALGVLGVVVRRKFRAN